MSSLEAYPHQLGIETIKYLDTRLARVFEIQESYNTWLDEVLEQCKKACASAEPELLPKTPSAKRSRRRYRIDESQDEDFEEPPKKRQSLAKKGKGRKKGRDETETEEEADDEGDTVETSPPRTTRRTRAASRANTSTRPARSTRPRKKANTGSENEMGPVMCMTTDIVVNSEDDPAEMPKPLEQLADNDLRNKLTKKSSLSSLSDASTPVPSSTKTPRAVPNLNHKTAGLSTVPSGSPRPGYMTVKERASQYDQKVLSSGGNTPTPKGSRINLLTYTRLGSKGSKNNTPQTPATPPTVKSHAKISLSSHHTSSSSAKRTVSKISNHRQPTTPVARNKTGNNQAGKNMGSMRRSLKLTASKTRRSSILRHSRRTITLQADGNGDTGAERSPSDKSNKSKDTQSENKVQETAPLAPKTSKLKLKKTKVLRPKVTRSAARQAENEEKMKTNLSEVSQSSDVSSSRTSSETRRQTVTLEKSSLVSEDVSMKSENSDEMVEAKVDKSSEEQIDLDSSGKSVSDTVDTCSSAEVKSDGKQARKSDNKAQTRNSSTGKQVRETRCGDQARKSGSSSDQTRKSSNGDQARISGSGDQARNSRGSDQVRKLRSSDQSRKSDDVEEVIQSDSSDQTKSDSNEQRKKSGPRLSRKSSESRKARGGQKSEEKMEETANLHPKRTTRSARNKASSSSCPSPEVKGTLRQSSRLRSQGSKSSINCEEMSGEEGSNDVFAVPGAPPPRTSRSQRKRFISDSDDGTDELETKRPCTDGKKSESERSSSETESTTDQNESDEEKTTSDSDGDIAERSPTCPANKVVRPHPHSFLNILNKEKSCKLFNLNPGTELKSFLRSSPVRRPLSIKEKEVLRRKELEVKQRKEKERMDKRKQQLQAQVEVKKRQREEHLRKVQNMRLQKQKKEQEDKDKLLEKMEHKNKIPEQVLEVKRKEKQEKKQIRQQKHTEAEERRLQEEGERLRKLKDKEEEDRQHAELLQRKREFEEQERAKRIAEEKQRQEEYQREVEKKRKEEEIKLLQQQQEEEKLKLKVQAEREREQQRLRAERYEKERVELEGRRQRDLEDELKKLRELEKQRKVAEIQRQEEKRQIEERYRQLMNGQKATVSVMGSSNPKAEIANLNSTMTLSHPSEKVHPPKSPQSYMMTPPKKYQHKKVTEDSIDISGLRSDESTDEEDAPKRQVPSWAQGSALKVCLVNQEYKPIDSDSLFGPIRVPDLNLIFVQKKSRFNKRTSSANWDSPLLKSNVDRT